MKHNSVNKFVFFSKQLRIYWGGTIPKKILRGEWVGLRWADQYDKVT